MILKYYLIQKHINHFISEYILLQEKMFRIPGKEWFFKRMKGLEEIRIHCFKKMAAN